MSESDKGETGGSMTLFEAFLCVFFTLFSLNPFVHSLFLCFESPSSSRCSSLFRIPAPSFFLQTCNNRFLACCGYKRGVDYKIMKIYGSSYHDSTRRRIERKGYAICRAFRELCSRLLMKMAEQQWQLPGALSRFTLVSNLFLLCFLSQSWYPRYKCSRFIVVTW